jgi:hypothetical protein
MSSLLAVKEFECPAEAVVIRWAKRSQFHRPSAADAVDALDEADAAADAASKPLPRRVTDKGTTPGCSDAVTLIATTD